MSLRHNGWLQQRSSVARHPTVCAHATDAGAVTPGTTSQAPSPALPAPVAPVAPVAPAAPVASVAAVQLPTAVPKPDRDRQVRV